MTHAVGVLVARFCHMTIACCLSVLCTELAGGGVFYLLPFVSPTRPSSFALAPTFAPSVPMTLLWVLVVSADVRKLVLCVLLPFVPPVSSLAFAPTFAPPVPMTLLYVLVLPAFCQHLPCASGFTPNTNAMRHRCSWSNCLPMLLPVPSGPCIPSHLSIGVVISESCGACRRQGRMWREHEVTKSWFDGLWGSAAAAAAAAAGLQCPRVFDAMSARALSTVTNGRVVSLRGIGGHGEGYSEAVYGVTSSWLHSYLASLHRSSWLLPLLCRVIPA